MRVQSWSCDDDTVDATTAQAWRLVHEIVRNSRWDIGPNDAGVSRPLDHS